VIADPHLDVVAVGAGARAGTGLAVLTGAALVSKRTTPPHFLHFALSAVKVAGTLNFAWHDPQVPIRDSIDVSLVVWAIAALGGAAPQLAL